MAAPAPTGAQQDVPAKPSAAKPQAKKKAARQVRPEYHVVQSGEDLIAIAKRYGLDYRAVAEWNNIPYPRHVDVGQRLRLYPPGVFPDSSPDKTASALATVQVAPVAAAATAPPPVPDRAPPNSGTAPRAAEPARPSGAADATAGAVTSNVASGGAPSGVAELRLPRSDYPTVTPEMVAEAQAQEMQAQEMQAPAPVPAPAGERVSQPPLSTTTEAAAKEREQLEVLRQTTLNLIQLLVQSGILTQEKADALIQQAKHSAAESVAANAEAQSKVVRVPYVPQFMRDEMKEDIKKDVMAQAKQEGWAAPNTVPSWVDRFTFNGDLRLRFQGNYLSPNNGSDIDVQDTNAGNGLVFLNTTDSFDYLRYQLRFGFDVNVSDGILAGVRLGSGNTVNPVSLNQTLGNGFNKNTVVIDLAYLKLDPYKWLTLWGGRMPNPWFYTDLVWYDQLNFDGLAAQLKTDLPNQSKGAFTFGAFPVQTIDCTTAVSVGDCGSDKWLYAAQGVFETALHASSGLKFGLAYYGWQNYEGRLNDQLVNPANRTNVPFFAQKGNTYFNIVTNGGPPLLGVASRFKDVDLVGSLDLGYWDPVHVVLTGDIVKNIAYDREEIKQRTGGQIDLPGRTNAWFARLTVGKPVVDRWGDWQVFQQEHLPFELRHNHEKADLRNPHPYLVELDGDMSLSHVEKIHISQVLERLEWNKSKAAKLLGISRATLREKIKRYDLSNHG